MKQLILLLILFPNGEASRVTFEASPKEIMQNITTSASMLCMVTDNSQTRAASSPADFRHISSIYILRGDSDDVASVTAFDPATALVDSGNLDVKGSVSAISGEGSIELSWIDPSMMVMGEYTCTVSGIDSRGHNMVLNTQLTITTVTPTIKDLIDNINLKMEHAIQKFEQDKQQQQQEIDQLVQDNQQQQQNITHQQQELSTLHQNATHQQQELSILHQNATHQQQEISILQQATQQLQDKQKACSQQVAFHAVLSGSPNIPLGQTVVYSDTLLNSGHAYNNTTGAFTCTLPGIYMFIAQGWSINGSHVVRINMNLNSATVSSIVAGVGHDNFDSGTMSATLRLKAGDVVKVVTVTQSFFYSVERHVNFFSGHLIQSDGCQ